jgi:hypothetical protein
MYDISAPYPYPENTSSPFLHWLVVNIGGQERIVSEYMPPSPPEDSPPYEYVVEIFEQMQGSFTPIKSEERANFPLGGLIGGYGLSRIGSVYFRSGYEIRELPGAKVEESEGSYFLPETPLDERQKSHCRCVLHVAAQNPDWCNRENAWFQKREGKKCYNPYAVCTSSIGTQSECSVYYNFSNIPDNELIAYALLRNGRIPIPEPYNREEMIDNIEAFRLKKK